MRRRAPLLFQLYFGERAPGAAPGVGSAGGGKLSDLLLRQHDEALTRQRLAREQAREAEAEQETDSEEEEEARQAEEELDAESEEEEEEEAEGMKRTDSRGGIREACGGASRSEAAVSRPAGAASAGPSAARSLQAEGADTRRALPPSSSPRAQTLRRHGAGPGSSGGGGSGPPGAGGAEGGDPGNGRTGMGAAEGGYRVEGGDAGSARAGMGGGGGGAGASATAAVDKEDFLELMRARFLAGLDEDVDYAAIDADRSLDDDFQALAEQDALDQYFDGD